MNNVVFRITTFLLQFKSQSTLHITHYPHQIKQLPFFRMSDPINGKHDSNLEAGHYVVTAHPPGSVIAAQKCSFLEPQSIDVAIAKSNRIEIRQLVSRGSPTGGNNMGDSVSLPLVLELPIRGRICTLISFSHNSLPTDLLFFTTDKNRYAVISYSPSSPSRTITHASGTLFDGVLKESECGPLVALDPQNRCLSLHLYDGYIHILPIEAGYTYPYDSYRSSSNSSSLQYSVKKKGRTNNKPTTILGEPFNVRIDERTILNMCFLGPSPSDNNDDSDGMDRKLPARPTTNVNKVTTEFSRNIPELVLLHMDTRGYQHIISHYVDLKRREMIRYSSAFPLIKKSRVDGGSGHIIPVNGSESSSGAVLVLGQKHITFHSSSMACTKTIPLRRTLFLSYCKLFEGRYLLGDENGTLYILVLEISSEGSLTAFHIESLSQVAVPISLVYLCDEVVFVGSQYSDSQLITSLLPEVRISEEYVNLGPIVDFDLVPTSSNTNNPDSRSNKQSQIVTCSGTSKDGSIRIVRNGIGVEEQASVDLPGIKEMWNLRAKFEDDCDKYLIQSFLGETRVLAFGFGDNNTDGGELEEVVLPGLDAKVTSLFCINVRAGLVQVTENGVRLLETNSWGLQHSWQAEDGKVTVGSGNEAGEIVVALRGGILVFLKISLDGIKEISRRKMDQEVSCIDLTLLENLPQNEDDMDIGDDFNDGQSSIVAVGLWNDVTVRLLSLCSPSLEELQCIKLEGDTQARSVIMAKLGEEKMLLIGLGDGNLVTFGLCPDNKRINTIASISSCKKVSLGTQSISLKAFQSSTTSKSSKYSHSTCIFATGDRPTVIYTTKVNSLSSNNPGYKLTYSNINLSTSEQIVVNNVAPFRLPGSSDSGCCLCLADEASLRIGVIDDIQKLHVQTMRLNGGAPTRITHHAVGKTFAVGSETDGSEPYNFIRFLDDTKLDEFDRVNLEPFETVLSILSTNLVNASNSEAPPRPFIIVGTAYVFPDEDTPKRGRILLFEIIMPKESDHDAMDASSILHFRTVRQVTEHNTNGAVYSIVPFNEGAIIGSINSKTNMYKFYDVEGIAELRPEPGVSHHGHMLSYSMKSLPSSPNLAIVGDLMRSISVIEYSPQQNKLDEIARDYNANWMTAVEMLNDEVYLGAENFNHLFSLKRNTKSKSKEVRCRLETQGEYHLGESVNKFMKGSLCMMPSEGHNNDTTTPKDGVECGSQTLYATIDGSIGVVLGLSENALAFFSTLERALAQVIPGIGGLRHDEYRAFEVEKRFHPCHGFVDGDMIESFLDLDRPLMENVVSFMNEDGGWEIIQNVESSDDTGLSMIVDEQDEKMGSPTKMSDKRRVLTVEHVIAKVETISRLH